MVRLREIPRTATFAWSSGSAPPLIATGTKAGAVDADFSNDTTLELWDLGLDNVEQGTELQPVGSIGTDSRHVAQQASESSMLDKLQICESQWADWNNGIGSTT